MKRPGRQSPPALSLCALGLLALLAAPGAVMAHSASDAYLTLNTDTAGSAAPESAGKASIHGQWDIALRDLDFVLKLDSNGDGRITWGEVRHRTTDIESYAYPYLEFDGGPHNPCAVKPRKQMIDDHADGAYAALFFDVICRAPPRKLTMSYHLFFAIDPSHRGIFVMNTGANVSTALLAPDHEKIDLVF